SFGARQPPDRARVGREEAPRAQEEAATGDVSAGSGGAALRAPVRQEPRSALRLPPLRRSALRRDAPLSVVRHGRPLFLGGDQVPAGLPVVRARRPARMELLPVVLRGTIRIERTQAALRSESGADLPDAG